MTIDEINSWKALKAFPTKSNGFNLSFTHAAARDLATAYL